MTKSTKDILNVLWYLVVFLLIQVFTSLLLTQLIIALNGKSVANEASLVSDSMTLIIISVISSILTIVIFLWRKWSPFHRDYVKTRPWAVIAWVILLALGSILPLEWIYEQTGMVMPEHYVRIFTAIMGERWGYLALGILAPVAEEMVFRGAILRTLLSVFKGKMAWFAIFISALLFGVVHGNILQGLHATFIGLLLGWMYHRSGSIIPGVVYHWVNNTVVYVMYNLMPEMADGKLIDLFNGSNHTMMLGIFFSLCIFIPALFQLNKRIELVGVKEH